MPKYTDAMFNSDLAKLETLINKYEATGGAGDKKWNRSFTVVEIDGTSTVPTGRYRIGSGLGPLDAARRAFKQLCRKNKNMKECKMTFMLKETTSKSKHNVYGPYEGHKLKLKNPKVIKINGKNIKIGHEYKVKKLSQKGGWVFYN